MCSGRAIKVNGRNLILAKKSNSANMQFFFDQKTRTLKSWQHRKDQLIFNPQVDQPISKSGPQTPTGGKSSRLKERTS